MNYKALIPFAALLLSGCATATLPQGPNIYSLAPRPGAATILVAQPADQRTDKKRLGSIGALSLSMKADPSELLAKEMVAALYEQNVNGVMGHVSSGAPADFAQAARQANAQGVLALNIRSISIKSFDVLMDPPTAEVTLQASLYNSQGNTVESDTVTGHVQKRINTFSSERATGELVGEAIHDAAQRLMGTGALGGALKKLSANTTNENQ